MEFPHNSQKHECMCVEEIIISVIIIILKNIAYT